MSTSRRNKKVKPINLEDQPIISQFIVDSAISPASPESTKNQETKNKKRRRSTGNNNPVNKRRNSVPDPLTSTEENPNKMTDTPVEMSSATNTMLNEIKRMEERLSAQITTSKDKELSEIEERLNTNIKNTIDTSIKDALKVMQTSFNSVAEKNPTIRSHSTEIRNLKDENSRLNQKLQQLMAEQGCMKRQLNKIENMALEHSIIIKGIQEELKETEQMICDKIHHALSKIMQGDTDETKLLNAQRITIKSCRRLGRFLKFRTQPISVELYHKQDIEFILENKFDLDQGIYVDCEYPLDVERKQKILLPVL